MEVARMSVFTLIRDYIAALRAQTAATLEATAVAERAVQDAAWARYQERRPVHVHGHHHHHGHAGGNASLPGGCAD
jgi:hypothetical protein